MRLLPAALFLAVMVTLPASGQHVNCRTNYYSVQGATVREIHQSLRQARPWKQRAGHDGFTIWNVQWRFGTMHNGSVCRLANFSTTTTIEITLPRWTAPTNAAELVKVEWTRYIKSLGEHEYGHAQFALIAAGEIHKRIKEAREDANCENLKQRVNGLCQGIVQTHKQMDEAYDQRTEHGAKQGARLGRRPEIAGEAPK